MNTIRKLSVEFRYYLMKCFLPMPNICPLAESIQYIYESKKSIARFGDGEFHMVNMSENLGFQQMNTALAIRLREILRSSNENCLVCLPYGLVSVRGRHKEGAFFWKQFLVFHYRRLIPLINFKNKYYDACITRPYMDFKDKKNSKHYFDLLKKIWTNKKTLIIEGEFSRLGIGNDLFDECSHIDRVITSSKNAFDKYEEILNYTKSIIQQYDLVLIALGPTATVLAYDLSGYGVQVLDIGHIDIEYEWYLQGTLRKIAIKGKHVNEVIVNPQPTDFVEKSYSDQIIKRIF